MLWQVFGAGTLPTSTPVPSRRGEAVFWPVFGTATLPTGTSVASPRGETVIYRHFEEATDACERQKSNAKWGQDRKG